MKLYDTETCRCDEAAQTDRFKTLRGLQGAVVAIQFLGVVLICAAGLGIIVNNLGAGSAGPSPLAIGIGIGVIFTGVIHFILFGLIGQFMGWLIDVGEDVRRAAEALEATGEIVARQDAEWRKKAESPGPE
jgi:UPF0716 family protein affecting phage T7 exclusion